MKFNFYLVGLCLRPKPTSSRAPSQRWQHLPDSERLSLEKIYGMYWKCLIHFRENMI